MKTLTNTLADKITLARLGFLPVLLFMGYRGDKVGFLVTFVLYFLADGLDGLMARKQGGSSASGARLDSWVDWIVLFPGYFVLLYLNWDRILELPFLYVQVYLAIFFLSIVVKLVGYLRLRFLPTLHLSSKRFSQIPLVGFVIALTLGWNTAPLFYVACLALIIGYVEEAIVYVSTDADSFTPDIRGLKDILRVEEAEARE